MSIYPVRLKEWFPPGDEHFDVILMITSSGRCRACDKKTRYQSAVGDHSLMVGHGYLYCSWKCCESGKVAKGDKRRLRRLKRRWEGLFKDDK
jgi:hypothetical protein